MKKVSITCDSCGKDCEPNDFSSFFYFSVSLEGKEMRRGVIEQNYCNKHTLEIKEFIQTLK